MITKYLLTMSLISQSVFASNLNRSDEIQKWVEVTPQKGYILSIDLFQEKMCSKIWSKQLKEFKAMNPQIKNPNLILVNKKIKVQDCRMEIKEMIKETEAPKQSEVIEKPRWFLSVYTGLSTLGSKSDDTAKNGYSLGGKVGRESSLWNKKLSLALGYFVNKAKTDGSGNNLGEYEVASSMGTFDIALYSKMSQKWELGPKIVAVFGDDVSMAEKSQNSKLGAYLGLESLYNFKQDVSLELNVQQRIEDLSRLSLLGNIGIRFRF